MADSTADREIVIERLFNAPKELVFEAWTNPQHVEKWWGPSGFSVTTHEIEIKQGGVWRFIMHGPDGTDYPNRIIFKEIEKPNKLVYTHDDDNADGPVSDFLTEVTFETKGDKTLLTMRSLFATAEARDLVIREFGAVEGGKQHLSRLEKFLATL